MNWERVLSFKRRSVFCPASRVHEPDVLVEIELAECDTNAIRQDTRGEAEHLPHAGERSRIAFAIEPDQLRQQRRLDGTRRVEQISGCGNAELRRSCPAS